MPRDMSGVFAAPAGTLATSGTAIESAKYNAWVNDLVAELNTAIPLVRGGTGTTTVAGFKAAFDLESGVDVQAYSAALASLAGLTTAANKMVYTTAANTYAVTDLSAFARTILDDADAAAVLATIGAQPADAALTSLAGLSLVAGDLLYATGADTLVRLPKGTAGQQLRMNSGATAPEWATPTAVSGFDLLGTITTTSGATATLSGLTLTGYKFLRLVLNGVSTNGSGSLTLNSIAVNDTATLGEFVSGCIEIDLSSGIFWAATGRAAAGRSASGGGASGLTTASTSFTIGAGGNTFDAGSVRVYGVI